MPTLEVDIAVALYRFDLPMQRVGVGSVWGNNNLRYLYTSLAAYAFISALAPFLRKAHAARLLHTPI